MLTTVAALLLAAPAAAPPPKIPTRLESPVVKFLGVAKSGMLAFEVSNPNAAPLPYYGYTPESFTPRLAEGTAAPWYRVELRRGNEWKPMQDGRCGVGRGPVSVPARGKVTFEAQVPGGVWDELRVGLPWFRTADWRDPAVTWSGGVSRKEAGLK